MSFYGNVYYLAEQAFAKYAFRNSGIENIIFPNPDKIMDERLIDASDSNQGLSIDTGNRWIALTSSPEENANGYTMWHNSPDTEDLTGLECFSITDKKDISPEVKEEDITQIKFSDYIKIPFIHYDTAGHVSTVQGASYYKMPEDPTEDLLGRMNDIDGRDNDPVGSNCLSAQLNYRMNLIDGEDEKNDTISLKYQLGQRMNEVEKKAQDSVQEVQAIANSFNEYIDRINELYKWVYTGEPGVYSGLLTRVTNLEKNSAGD